MPFNPAPAEMQLLVMTHDKVTGFDKVSHLHLVGVEQIHQYIQPHECNALDAGEKIVRDSEKVRVEYVDLKAAYWLFTDRCSPARDMRTTGIPGSKR